MERPEVPRLLNCPQEQMLSIGERPSVFDLQTIQWMKALHEQGEWINVVMDSEEEGEEPRGKMCVEEEC
jgi:hypothetical protein